MRALAIVAIVLVVAQAGLAQPEAPVHAPWRHPDCRDPAETGNLPTGPCRHMRILIEADVPSPLRGLANIPARLVVDVGAALRNAGYPSLANGQLAGFELDMASLALVEVAPDSLAPLRVDSTNRPLAEAILTFPGDLAAPTAFDARSNPVITLQWVLQGLTHGPRSFFLYLDSTHNGVKAPVQVSDSQLGQVAAAIGPGRGDTHYVSLHGDIGLATATDPRSVTVTNLQATPLQVDVIEYGRFGVPDALAATIQVPGGVGTTARYTLRTDYAGEALKLVTHGGLALVEADSRVGLSSFKPGSTRAFLPSADGGYVGTLFAGQSPVATQWVAYCPAVQENKQPCKATLGGTAVDIPIGETAQWNVAANQPAVLRSTGLAAVQRVPAGATSASQFPMALWPPLDGPVTSLQFAGDARGDDGTRVDKLVLAARTAASRLEVGLLHGARTELSDGLDPRGPSLFTDAFGGGWGTTWNRDWRLASQPTKHPQHDDGPTAITDIAGSGLLVMNGHISSDETFSALVAYQSPDGGMTYQVVVPGDRAGNALGRMAVFAPYAGTDVQAVRTAGGQASALGLQRDEYLPAFIDRPGSWTVTASRPILLVWLKVGDNPLSAFAPATGSGAMAVVKAAQFSGYAFAVETDDFVPGRPGSSVQLELRLANLGRRTDGSLLDDSARITAQAPPGWATPKAIPATVALAGTPRSTVDVAIPATTDVSTGGATVTVRAQSHANPGFVVTLPVRINFEVKRGVDVSADGHDTASEHRVGVGETATFELRLINTGTVADRFQIEHSTANAPWSMQVHCLEEEACFEQGVYTTPLLSPGQALDFLVEAATVAASTSRLTVQFLAASFSDPSVTDAVRLVAALDATRDLQVLVDEAVRFVPAGTTAHYNVTLANFGDQDEELLVRVSRTAPPGWPMPVVEVIPPRTTTGLPLGSLNNTVGIPTQESAMLLVRQDVPAGARVADLGVVRIALESRVGAKHTSEHQLRAVVAREFGLDLTAIGGPLSIVPTTTVTTLVKVTSLANVHQEVGLNATVEPPSKAWSISIAQEDLRFNLTPGQTRWVNVTLSAAAQAPPDSAVRSTLIVRSTNPGMQAAPLRIGLSVPEAPRIELTQDRLRLEAGRNQTIWLDVANLGNIPLNLSAVLDGLPGWAVTTGSADLPVMANGTLQVTITPPPGMAGELEAIVRLLHEGKTVHEAPLTLTVRATHLEVATQWMRSLDGGLSAVSLTVTNLGVVPARNVLVQILEGGRIIDSVFLDTILPGATSVANLVTRLEGGAEILVTTADDPEGQRLQLAGDKPAQSRGYIPATPWLLALAALALARRMNR